MFLHFNPLSCTAAPTTLFRERLTQVLKDGYSLIQDLDFDCVGCSEVPHTCMHACVYVCPYVHVYVHICVYICICIHVHVCMCINACVCIYIYEYTYVFLVYIYTYMCGMNLSVLCDIFCPASEHYLPSQPFLSVPFFKFSTVSAAQGNLCDSTSKAAPARTRVKQNENVTR